MDVCSELEPKKFWKAFSLLSAIPRCSGNEEAAAQFAVNWAKNRGLDARRDRTGNVIINVPATPGRENAPIVILQGHLDMVGEKDSSSNHNFETDPIEIIREGDYITANGTTLGGDNGVAIAGAMALCEDETLEHGPLELLFTIDEERGLTGAKGLEKDALNGRILLNLDSEEEGDFCVGCAGGVDTTVDLNVEREPVNGHAFKLLVKGGLGGHSGCDINEGRQNAILILVRWLEKLRTACGNYYLQDFQAGDKHNAIPREAVATIILPDETPCDAFFEVETEMRGEVLNISKHDPGLTISHEKASLPGPVWAISQKSRDHVLELLLALPHGVLAMSQEVDGLVETSTNLAVVKLQDDHIHIHEASRSSCAEDMERVRRQIQAVATLAGATYHSGTGYPGWQPNTDSPLLHTAQEVYTKLFGKPANVKAIHAGLECGLIGERFTNMDMLSFGPDVEWPHSPSERISISSVGRFFQFLSALVSRLSEHA